MRRPTSFQVLLVLVALTLVSLALVGSGASAPAVALTPDAEGRTGGSGFSRAATYTCQYSGVESGVVVPGGLPAPVLPALGGSDPVQVEVQVDAPAKIAPGEALALSGTATFTFGANATATNAATVFTFLSDSFGVDVASGGQHRFLRIAELETSRSTPDSGVVTAEWALPDYVVPNTADGQLTLSMPHEAVATNPVSTSPESVAFTGTLLSDSAVQPERTVACALGEGQDTAIGAVKVQGGTTPQDDPSDAEPDAAEPTGTGTGTGTPTAPGLDPAAPVGSAPAPETVGTEAAPTVETPTLLAAEPIPAATVADGFRLPPWAMLFVGAFLAGGLFLAMASRRRLRLVAGGAAVLALLVAPTPLNPPSPAEAAAAAAGQAQVTLICVYEAQGSDSSDVPKDQPTGLSITLDVPASAAPGEVLTLTGSASVQAPEDIRNQASQLGYTTLDAISDAFSVGLTVGSGGRQVFLADRWQTGKTAFGNPLVVRAPLYFPSFKVPDDASGDIKLELPRNEVVDRRPPPYQNSNTPPKVAVEFLASVSGNGTSATYVVSCWRNDSGSGLIATIPVSKGSATTPATTPSAGTTGAAAPSGTGQPSTAAGQTGAPVTPTEGATGVPATGEVVPGTTPGATVASGAQLQGAAAGPAPVASSQDVVVPTWLALVAVLFALGTYGYAGWNHLRLRSGPGRPTR